MRVIESENFEIWESVQIENFLERADSVSTDVQIRQLSQLIKTGLNRVDLISRNPKLFQTGKVIKTLQYFNLVIADP